MHRPESVFLWDFEIQRDPFISARRQDFVIAKKKKREPAEE